MTAYEISQLRVDAQRVLGPIAGRIHAELIGPLTTRGFNIMMRAGAFAPIPRGLDSASVKIEYVNPLSRSQNAEDLNAITQWLQFAAGLAQAGRMEALDHIDVDESMKASAVILNVPASVQADDEMIDQVRQQRAQMQQQSMQMEMQTRQADINSKNSKAQQSANAGGGNESGSMV